jgi:hypothetical protein
MIIEAFVILALTLLSYNLKHIPREFNVMNELFVIAWLRLVGFIGRYELLFFHFKDGSTQSGPVIYASVFLELMQIMATGLYTLISTYKPNQIIPFPINEDCISNFVVAIIMPTSMTHFYQYLQGLPDFDEALIIFGLHADIRIYLRMCDEQQYVTKEQLHQKAVQIFEDYIIEDCKWSLRRHAGDYTSNKLSSEASSAYREVSPIPEEILREIRAGYCKSKIRFQLNSGLFSDLYIYTLERLRQYYEQFKQSKEFMHLREEVISQEILYEILRRYRMISV